MATQRKRTKKSVVEKKLCQSTSCGKEKPITAFYKVDSVLFPDGTINICKDCIKKDINIDDIEDVVGFLRQIDKTFNKELWDKVYSNKDKKEPIGAYLGMINSLGQYKDKTFKNSDNVDNVGNLDKNKILDGDVILLRNGEPLYYHDDMILKWGLGYTKSQYLQMEKFYKDMELTHDISTPPAIDSLTQLAYLSVDRNTLRISGNWADYSKISKTMDDMSKSAGFRPIDKQGLEDSTGIKSFSQIFEKVEKEGFRKPPKISFDEDIIDKMIIVILNYYHRLFGKEILTSVPEDVKQELLEFFDEDLTPVEINDEDYDNIDYTLEDLENELEEVDSEKSEISNNSNELIEKDE